MLTPDDLATTPHDNWRYTEPATGMPFSHHNLQCLIREIEFHRKGVNLPTHGAWIEDVYDAMCRQNPHLKCHDRDVPERTWTAEDVFRFLTTLKEVASQGAGMVTEVEQLRRIEICRTCPKNGVISCRWCGPLAEMLTEFIGSRNLPKVEAVYKRSCLSCGCDITSKTAFGVAVLKAVDGQLGTAPDYAPQCWMLED